jgi:hypothetical protein
LSTTFDMDRIKQTLCEQAVSFLRSTAHFDADADAKRSR